MATPQFVLRETECFAWRLHRGTERPLDIPQYPGGRHRFDSPEGCFRVTYANTARKGCIEEIYGDAGIIENGEGHQRHFFRFFSWRPLRMIAFDDPDVRGAFRLDTNIFSTLEYEKTQAWAQKLYCWYRAADGIQAADGIRYPGRNSAPELNYCFFLDRCGGDLLVEDEGQLRQFRRTVEAVARIRDIPSYIA